MRLPKKSLLYVLWVIAGILALLLFFWQRSPSVLGSIFSLLGLILLVIVIFPFVLYFWRRWSLRQYPTPYDTIEKELQKSPASPQSSDKPYAFFVSYKSDDAMQVRPLVEHLLAGGFKVWFAEYTIRLEGRASFEQAIASGIAHSWYGLCFTNDRYIQSLYCRDELERLLDPRNCGPSRVIEIAFPPEALPHRHYPQLETGHTIHYQDDPRSLLACLAGLTGLPINQDFPQPSASPACRTFDYGARQYRLDLAGWTVREEGAPVKSGGEAVGPIFERICGKYSIRGYLHLGTSIAFPRAQYQGDDRENYEYGVQFARDHYSIFPGECIGVHLFFLHGLSHITLTARSTMGWIRTYSVIIPLPGSGQHVEFLFDFYLRSPFEVFCQNTHWMDSVVQSLTWV
jgi:hypothetical protein